MSEKISTAAMYAIVDQVKLWRYLENNSECVIDQENKKLIMRAFGVTVERDLSDEYEADEPIGEARAEWEFGKGGDTAGAALIDDLDYEVVRQVFEPFLRSPRDQKRHVLKSAGLSESLAEFI